VADDSRFAAVIAAFAHDRPSNDVRITSSESQQKASNAPVIAVIAGTRAVAHALGGLSRKFREQLEVKVLINGPARWHVKCSIVPS
jgi:hypothetical protein